MRSESLDLHSVSMGPFAKKIDAFNFEVAYLHGSIVKTVFSLKEWHKMLHE